MKTILFSILIVLLCGGYAQATDEGYYLSQIQRVNEDIAAGKVSAFDIRYVLGQRVVDETNRVVGTIEDIAMNDRGNIRSIRVDMDRKSDVTLPPRYLRKHSNDAYQLTFHRDDVASIMAGIEPAAGSDAGLTGLDLLGAKIQGVSGERFGTVKSALLNSANTNVYAVVIRSSKRNVGDMALPVNSGMRTGPGRLVLLNSAYSSALNEYLKN